VPGGKERATLRGHGGEVTAIGFSPDGKCLASASWDRMVKIWNPGSGELKATLQGHAGVVTALAFSPDGQRLASCSLDHTVRIWDPLGAKELQSIRVQFGDPKPAAADSESPVPLPLVPGARAGSSREGTKAATPAGTGSKTVLPSPA